MKAVIMAGGDGVRLRPFTYMTPKPLLPVGDTTVLDHTIGCLQACGYDEIIISVHYQSDKFEKWLLKNRSNYNGAVKLFKEERKLGTAGSLFLVKKYLNGPFCLLNGDLIIKVRLDEMQAFHLQKKADITIGIKNHRVPIPYAIIRKTSDRRLLELKEKPAYVSFINTGIYIINPSVLDKIQREEYLDMPVLIQLVEREGGRVFVYDIGERWIDMGQIPDYERAIELIETWKE